MRAVLAVVAACGSTQIVRTPDATCAAIAEDIEKLGHNFRQLADFDATTARTGCHIDYARHTHRAAQTGGWSAGVPAPDPDGIWFHIGIWDPNDPAEAMSQINTQPDVPPRWIGDRKVTFLILEGNDVTPVASVITAVLRRHGLVER